MVRQGKIKVPAVKECNGVGEVQQAPPDVAAEVLRQAHFATHRPDFGGAGVGLTKCRQ